MLELNLSSGFLDKMKKVKVKELSFSPEIALSAFVCVKCLSLDERLLRDGSLFSEVPSLQNKKLTAFY